MDIIIGAVIFFALIVAAVVIAPTVKMAIDVAPFLYTNTRCSARSGLILNRKQYDSLLASTYLKEVYATLEDTAYSKVAEHGHQFGATSELLDKDLSETYNWLESIMPEKIQPIVAAMQKKFEINELKEAMSRLQDDKAIGELEYVQKANLKLKLEAATDMSSFITALEGSPYGDIINGENHVATELDKWYLLNVLDTIESCKDQKAAAPFKEYWRRVIDLANIRLALRNIKEKGEGIALIEGGFIPAEKLSGVGDKNQLQEALQETPYTEVQLDEDDLQLEHAFLTYIAQEGGRASAKHPLKGGPIIKFIVQKELEVRNLNIILKLKGENFDSEEINRLLVVS